MRARGIFLIRDGKPVVLSETPYDNEDIFQKVLAEFPEVLAGGTTTDGGDVRRLLLVTREMGVPSVEGGAATWSLDHLFIDETGVPVFVEVKRSSDTRIRREVVGQMLDYAANGLAYWPVDQLRRALESRSKSEHGDADRALQLAFGEIDQDGFWSSVEENLKEGNVRLVFVADHLPPELTRIIEFLNERMSPTEVLGVEVVQYLGEGHQLFVPELVGKTARAVTAKKKTQGRLWDEDSFLATTRERYDEGTETMFRSLFDHVRRHNGRLSWGRGVAPGVSGWYPVGGSQLAVWTANAGVYGRPDDAPALFIYPSEVREAIGPERFDRFISTLDGISAYRKELEEARLVDWTKKYPSCVLSSLATSDADRRCLLTAFDGVADPAPVVNEG